MGLEWEQLVIDAADPVALGRWWREALGWTVVNDSPEEYEIRPELNRLPGLLFGPAAEGKAGKNRLHLDFRPDDRDAEVERLLALGARYTEVGQRGDEPWVVLADPEGNEFCVLGQRSGG
uniref:VOC family protein n=1 Tax=Streptomyces sp. NBC_00008 TaxID=2903610 RepID=A0AAU2VHB0_9ACTN